MAITASNSLYARRRGLIEQRLEGRRFLHREIGKHPIHIKKEVAGHAANRSAKKQWQVVPVKTTGGGAIYFVKR